MKKVIALMLTVLTFCLCATSCVTVKIKIKDDGKISVNVDLGFVDSPIDDQDSAQDGADNPETNNQGSSQDGPDNPETNNGGAPYIGENGNWWINGVDTGTPAYGKDTSHCVEHEWNDVKITLQEHTPTSKGVYLVVCKKCSEARMINEDHDYSTVEIVEPTCTEEGYTKHICKCGGFIKDNVTPTVDHQIHGDYVYIDENCDCFLGVSVYDCIYCHSEELIYVWDQAAFVPPTHKCDVDAPSIDDCLCREGHFAIHYLFKCSDCDKWVLAYYEMK